EPRGEESYRHDHADQAPASWGHLVRFSTERAAAVKGGASDSRRMALAASRPAPARLVPGGLAEVGGGAAGGHPGHRPCAVQRADRGCNEGRTLFCGASPRARSRRFFVSAGSVGYSLATRSVTGEHAKPFRGDENGEEGTGSARDREQGEGR